MAETKVTKIYKTNDPALLKGITLKLKETVVIEVPTGELLIYNGKVTFNKK